MLLRVYLGLYYFLKLGMVVARYVGGWAGVLMTSWCWWEEGAIDRMRSHIYKEGTNKTERELVTYNAI